MRKIDFNPKKVKASKPTNVYIIQDVNGCFYVGVTQFLEKRLKQHQEGDQISSIFTRDSSSYKLFQSWVLYSKDSAWDLEARLHFILRMGDSYDIAAFKGLNIVEADDLARAYVNRYNNQPSLF